MRYVLWSNLGEAFPFEDESRNAGFTVESEFVCQYVNDLCRAVRRVADVG